MTVCVLCVLFFRQLFRPIANPGLRILLIEPCVYVLYICIYKTEKASLRVDRASMQRHASSHFT